MPDARARPASKALARLYTWCLRGADHVHAHRLSVCLIGAPLATLTLAATGADLRGDFMWVGQLVESIT